MKRLAILVPCAALVCGVAGCKTQTLTHREFYEPNKDTLHVREDGYAVGAIKSETVRSGSRDEGDKTFAFGLLNVND